MVSMGNATAKIVSGPEVTKRPGIAGSEIWGPYKKVYTNGPFGSKIFNPPATIDNVKILCRCRDIRDYMKTTPTLWARILSGITKPACWEDNEIPFISRGDDTYVIRYKDPIFTEYAISQKGIEGIPEKLTSTNVQASFMGIPWQVFAVGYGAKQLMKGGKKKRRRYTRRRN